jgi:hypothetical protein
MARWNTLERISKVADRIEADTAELHRLIVLARDERESLRAIAEAARLSHTQVAKIEQRA